MSYANQKAQCTNTPAHSLTKTTTPAPTRAHGGSEQAQEKALKTFNNSRQRAYIYNAQQA